MGSELELTPSYAIRDAALLDGAFPKTPECRFLILNA
jgi:hypothetical protein